MQHLHWQVLTPEAHQEIPSSIRSWLIHTGSLTTRLKEKCDNFSVEVIQQHRRKALTHEIKLLTIESNPYLIEREVLLWCNALPVVYARSFIPVDALQERFKDLENIGNQPLGEMIFADPELDRGNIEWSKLDQHHPTYPHATHRIDNKPSEIFGRRSLFYGAPSPILISEFFLPTISFV